MVVADYITDLGRAARLASSRIASASTAAKAKALLGIAEALEAARQDLIAANQQDLEQARTAGLEQPLVDRLVMDDAVIDQMIESLHQVRALPDPVGQISNFSMQPSGLRIGKMRVPLGVIAIIYESRPNVTIEAASLCLKSGNAVILRGGSEAITSNKALATCLAKGLAAAGLPNETVQLVTTTDRDAVGALIRMSSYVDVLIPRGGKALIKRITQEATVPVINHLDGVCHVYIDDSADRSKALAIALNSKIEKLSVCCAMETLLVAEGIAADLLPDLAKGFRASGIEIRGCKKTVALLPDADIKPAQEADWSKEYLGPVLAVRVVQGLDEAIAHIADYGSNHTDAIICERQDVAWRFLREVDSASVLVNASTQFADGFEFGLGAEVGISTNKLHVRGPVGLEGLTSEKFVVFGQGEIRNRKA